MNRVPCPRCPGTMKRGSLMCRACALAEMKRRFRGYFSKRRSIDIRPDPQPMKKNRKWRTA